MRNSSFNTSKSNNSTKLAAQRTKSRYFTDAPPIII